MVVAAIAAAMASGVIPTVIPAVYADSDNGRSDFGEQASDNLAKDGQMGEHSSDPLPGDDDREVPRDGIGNVFNDGDPKDSDASKHPSDTANTLCATLPDNEACKDDP
jgi:hypothetical protein